MFAVRNYQQGSQTLLAACDPGLLGQEYREDHIRLAVAETFYDGDRVDEERLRGLLSACTVANLVGERTVAVAVAMGIIDADHVRTVDGVPHAQMVTI